MITPILLLLFGATGHPMRPQSNAQPNIPCPDCYYNCSSIGYNITSWTSTDADYPTGCQVWPGAFSVTWNWDVYVYGGSGDTVYSDHRSRLGRDTAVAQRFPATTPTPVRPTHTTQFPLLRPATPLAATLYGNDTITSELPGGIIGKFGLGCAGTATASVVISIPAVLCKISPILIDAYGEGFHFSDVAHGIQFREYANSPTIQMSWTDPKYHNGWLALPKNEW